MRRMNVIGLKQQAIGFLTFGFGTHLVIMVIASS